MIVKEFYDKTTNTLTYIVYDQASRDAVIIDPVLDYNPSSGTFFYDSMKGYLSFINDNNLKLHYILETHAHADHITSSYYLKKNFPNAKVAIGAKITTVQKTFKKILNLDDVSTNGTEFDELFEDNQIVKAGTVSFKVLYTPGHTPACASYYFNNEFVFTGDALFMPDYGTGRCDFPDGDAKTLFQSVTNRLYTLPDDTKVYVGHDYQPNSRELLFSTTIAESKKQNIRITSITLESEFVKFREERDKTLDAPKLLLPSIQVNIRGGKPPVAEENGLSYLKIPYSEKR